MTSSEQWLLRDVVVEGRRCDCRIAGGKVVDLAPRLSERPAERVLDAAGGELLPGLADHHLHVLAAAAARRSIDLSGSDDLTLLAPPGSGWLRAVGVGRELTRSDLDSVVDHRPVRVQHRSGAVWTLNGVAVDLVAHGLTPLERETGQVWRDDRRLGRLVRDLDGTLDDEIRSFSRQLAAWGFTHLTDATPDLDESGMGRIEARVVQHMTFLGPTGGGPRKIVLHDHAPLDLDAVRDEVARQHDLGRPVALHAVSAPALAVAIAVLAEVGVRRGDRIEHAAVCDDDAARELARLGLVVVTQPTIYARRDAELVRTADPDEQPWLWRLAGLVGAGVRTVVSSDAPYGDADPAATIRAVAGRGAEALPAPEVVQSWLLDPRDLHGTPRRVAPGVAANLCLLGATLGEVLDGVRAGSSWRARATFVGGRRVH